MVLGKLIRYIIRLNIALVIGIMMASCLPLGVQAQEPIDLVLGGEGSVSWNIINVAPGDNGTKTVSLHNAGHSDGEITIWISGITSSEGSNPESETGDTTEPGELPQYLLFNILGSRLITNISLPTRINSLPQNASSSRYIKVSPLNAGETIDIHWQWELPAQTGNATQGDSLSFTLNYMLAELTLGGSEGDEDGWDDSTIYETLQIDILGKVTTASIDSSGRLLAPHVVSDFSGTHILELDAGTKLLCSTGKIPKRIEMKVYDVPISPLGSAIIIEPMYILNAYDSDSTPCSVTFEPPARLTLGYDYSQLPENLASLRIAVYHPGRGWTELETERGSDPEMGEATARLSDASVIAVLANVQALYPSPDPPIQPALPGVFELRSLVVSPMIAQAGQPVVVSVIAENTGELDGICTLTLMINDEVAQTREIALVGGQSNHISFTIAKEVPGRYVVTIGKLTGEFTLLAPDSSSPWIKWYWWLILAAIVAAGLAGYFLVWRRRYIST
jgi:hypothetical protein